MSNCVTIVVAAIVLVAAPAASAKDSTKGNGPPKIDMAKACRANTEALESLGTEVQNGYESCITDEQMARDQLTRDWAKYSEPVKRTCVLPQEYLPTYIEWLVCLDMTQDVLKTREKQAAGDADSSSSTTTGSSTKPRSSNRRNKPEARECPVVKLKTDGSIDYVIAC